MSEWASEEGQALRTWDEWGVCRQQVGELVPLRGCCPQVLLSHPLGTTDRAFKNKAHQSLSGQVSEPQNLRSPSALGLVLVSGLKGQLIPI